MTSISHDAEWETDNETNRTKLFRYVCWRVAVFTSLHGNNDRGGALIRQTFAGASHPITIPLSRRRRRRALMALCRFVFAELASVG